jgi:hypothetical protein
MPQASGLLNLAFVVLVPTIPAYLLFKALPSTAIVTGPLKGLTINLGGAFAGYFALLVLIFSMHNIWNPPPPYQVWYVKGEVREPVGSATHPLEMKDFQIEPAAFNYLGAGKFKLTLFTTPAQDGSIQFPDLRIDRTPYNSTPIFFEGASKDDSKHEITLPPITLTIQPAYNGGAAFVSPITPAPTSQNGAPQ